MVLALAPLDVTVLLEDPRRIAIAAQPIVDLNRGRVVGYEALARFTLDVPMAPDKVFAEAARRGIAEELEAAVVRHALEISRRTPQDCFFTINVDPLNLEAPQVQRAIREHGDLAGLVFEMTEHSEVDWRQLQSAIDVLRKRGALIAVDDAGSGYSGLKQLLEIRPQLLKLDRELVTNVHQDEAKRALVQMLGELAGRLDAWLLAEGIETAAELQCLHQLGVPLGQGYFLARPMPPWTGLLPAAANVLASAPRKLVERRLVDAIVEPISVLYGEDEWPPNAGVAMRVTADGRPLRMRIVDGNGEKIRSSDELLLVKRTTGMSALARRIAARNDLRRWDPIVCIGEDGKFEGIVRPQRLLCALADGEIVDDDEHGVVH